MVSGVAARCSVAGGCGVGIAGCGCAVWAVWHRLDGWFCAAGGAVAWGCAGFAATAGSDIGAGDGARQICACGVVLGRYATTGAGAVSGADGSAFSDGGQYWCVDNGVLISAYIYWVLGSATGG